MVTRNERQAERIRIGRIELDRSQPAGEETPHRDMVITVVLLGCGEALFDPRLIGGLARDARFRGGEPQASAGARLEPGDRRAEIVGEVMFRRIFLIIGILDAKLHPRAQVHPVGVG